VLAGIEEGQGTLTQMCIYKLALPDGTGSLAHCSLLLGWLLSPPTSAYQVVEAGQGLR
jgi:hypothetical protein